MKPKKTDLVSGRLGKGAKAPDAAAAGGAKPPNYGVNRLGISRNGAGQPAEAQLQPAGPIPFEFDLPTIAKPLTPPPAGVKSQEPGQKTDEVRESGGGSPALSSFSVPPYSPQPQARPIGHGAPRLAIGGPRFIRPLVEFAVSNKKLLMYAGGVALVIVGILALRSWNSDSLGVPAPAAGAGILPAVTAKPTPRPAVAARRSPIDTPLGAEFSRQMSRLRSQGEDVILQFKQAAWTAEDALVDLADLTKGPQPRIVQSSAPIKYRECPPGIRLSGIIACSDGAYACLNDKMVKVGGVVNGAKVVAVGDFSVEMELDGERFIVGVGAGMPDRPSAPAPDVTTDEDYPPAQVQTPATMPSDKNDDQSSDKPKSSRRSSRRTPAGPGTDPRAESN
ncbi:MAG: hypothetical protein ACE15C_04675 [Phycisphaerae bacterium]